MNIDCGELAVQDTWVLQKEKNRMGKKNLEWDYYTLYSDVLLKYHNVPHVSDKNEFIRMM